MTNMVAFRLDDIQDNYVTQTQIDLMNVFKEGLIPLTAAIIAHDFGTDAQIVSYVKEAASNPNWNFEVANHGWVHEDFSKAGTKLKQAALFRRAIDKTITDLAGSITEIKTFVAPYNAFNLNTIKAMSEVGLTVLSSELDLDLYQVGVADINNVYHWPIGASTTDLPDTKPVCAEETFAQIKHQMRTYGYASVMMHPDEFSNHMGKGPTNATAIASLKHLIQLCVTEGYQFTTLGDLASAWAAASSTNPPSNSTVVRPRDVATQDSKAVDSLDNVPQLENESNDGVSVAIGLFVIIIAAMMI